MKTTTNIYPIENLDEISYEYILYKMSGLSKSSDDYEKNKQIIGKKLSYKLKHPVLVIEKEGQPHLVIKATPEIMAQIPEEIELVRDTVYLDKLEETFYLDFENHTSENCAICLRFLNFDLQTGLFGKYDLWQPGAGRPYFSRKPYFPKDKDIAVYEGFIARVIEIPGGFGIAIDVTQKFISKYPLRNNLDATEFKRNLKNKTFLYKYDNWYEIKAKELHDLTVSRYKFEHPHKKGERISLIDFIREETKSPHSPELSRLSDDTSVIFYKSNRNERRGVPSSLCFQVYDTEDIGRLQRTSILDANVRKKEIYKIRRNYFNNLSFGDVRLKIARDTYTAKKSIFISPDLEFGNNTILSIRNTPNTTHTTIDNLGKNKKELLANPDVGFYSDDDLSKHIIVLPKSIYESMGKKFTNPLVNEVNTIYKSGASYNPQIITYDDRNKYDYIELGFTIIEAIEEKIEDSCHGVVMIPLLKKGKRKHDELGAMLIRMLREKKIYISIIHTTVTKSAFEYVDSKHPPFYRLRMRMRGKFNGYISNVAMTKVLLNDEKIPFALHTPLNADLTITIDVKHNTVGMTFIGKYARSIRPEYNEYNEKEKLSKERTKLLAKEGITKEIEFYNYTILNIVIQRDGRLFESEKNGLIEAVEELKNEGILEKDCQLTFVEIPKSSIHSVRLFNPLTGYYVENPNYGSYTIMGEYAYLCNTGKEFPRAGTVNPLVVKYNSGFLTFEQILEDIFYLANLTYSKVDDCSRYPLGIKYTDNLLADIATKYDEDKAELIKQTL